MMRRGRFSPTTGGRTIRTMHVMECHEESAVARAFLEGYDLGLGAADERERTLRAQLRALAEVAEAAMEGATDVAPDAEEPAGLTPAERDAFTEIVFGERVHDLLDGETDQP